MTSTRLQNKKATCRNPGMVATPADTASGRRLIEIALRCDVQVVATVELVNGVPIVLSVRIADLVLAPANERGIPQG